MTKCRFQVTTPDEMTKFCMSVMLPDKMTNCRLYVVTFDEMKKILISLMSLNVKQFVVIEDLFHDRNNESTVYLLYKSLRGICAHFHDI